MQDSSHILQDQIRHAADAKQSLRIRGGNSKKFYGRKVEGEALKTTIHTGIIAYEPTELVMTARAGTPLEEIESALGEKGQILACEPPRFGQDATLGGMVAAGLSGPARPYRAAVQDTVLGCTMINGRGEILRFGGKVMKNVAGYDISRTMVGSLGCLGVLLDITFKVIPTPKAETTITFGIERGNSLAFINELRRQGLPVSASCQAGEQELQIRFSAGHDEISGLTGILKKHYGFIPWQENSNPDFWLQLKEQQVSFFETDDDLWRLSVPPDTDISELGLAEGDMLTEWGGALHWLKTTHDRQDIFDFAASMNGHACLFRSGGRTPNENVFQPLEDNILSWHCRLKLAFDPAGILNPGRMYSQF